MVNPVPVSPWTSLAVMGLLSEEAQVSEGSIQLNGQELLGMSREERRKIQGKNMSMVFQEPMTSLNPVMKIGTQVGESLKLHTDLDKEAIRGRVIEALASVGLRNRNYWWISILMKFPAVCVSV